MRDFYQIIKHSLYFSDTEGIAWLQLGRNPEYKMLHSCCLFKNLNPLKLGMFDGNTRTTLIFLNFFKTTPF